jgi:hypothetical protein
MKVELFENLGNLTPYVVGAVVLVWAIERIISIVLRKDE